MGLTPEELSRIIELRRTLHQNPELAGGEGATAGLGLFRAIIDKVSSRHG